MHALLLIYTCVFQMQDTGASFEVKDECAPYHVLGSKMMRYSAVIAITEMSFHC